MTQGYWFVLAALVMSAGSAGLYLLCVVLAKAGRQSGAPVEGAACGSLPRLTRLASSVAAVTCVLMTFYERDAVWLMLAAVAWVVLQAGSLFISALL